MADVDAGGGGQRDGNDKGPKRQHVDGGRRPSAGPNPATPYMRGVNVAAPFGRSGQRLDSAWTAMPSALAVRMRTASALASVSEDPVAASRMQSARDSAARVRW